LDIKTKYVFKGIVLTILSAIFAVIGLIVAVMQNLVAGVFIVAGSSIFWGYACLLSSIAKLRVKEKQS
jgi:polyferredoxin